MVEINSRIRNEKHIKSEYVLPSFFVLGAHKSCFSSLHHHLARHPDIALPAIKETHFFDDGHGEFRLGISHYINKYFHAETRRLISGEIDPEYLFFPEAAPRIAKYFPNAKLIFMFRDPVARAYSHYQMSFSRGRERLSFIEAIAREDARMGLFPESINPTAERVVYRPSAPNEEERRRLFNHVVRSDFSYVGRGFYFRQVERYLEFFPKKQMLFLLSNDMKDYAAATLKRVYDHIGVREVPFISLARDQTNEAALPRSTRLQRILLDRSPTKMWMKLLIPSDVRLRLRKKLIASNTMRVKLPAIDSEIDAHLRTIYQEDSQKLAKLIGRDLSSWLPK
ncbi:MAG: sulfotransferase [Gammaproteobacteria bacterium]|nr:sulfotransferase [Gammaproteobacteria bacterium]